MPLKKEAKSHSLLKYHNMKLIENASKAKLRGGFYTPNPIAAFVLKWAFNGNKKNDILEPSCGDGVFLEEILNGKYSYNSITAIELDALEAAKAKKINLPKTNVINNDFHDFCVKTNKKFDLIVGNPPYIRYQYFSTKEQVLAQKIFNKAGLHYSKLTNAWVSFVVGASLLLKAEGKIGFILPAEILQVSYAKALREFLAHYYNKINIVSFKKLVFPDIQQEVVLLLCEKNSSNAHLIEHLEVNDAQELHELDVAKLKTPKKRIDFRSNKWTYYFLDQEEIDFLETVASKKSIPKLKDFVDVEVGITTGSNPFFTVPTSTVEKYELHKYAKPVVGRSVQAKSIFFTKNDWLENTKSNTRAHILIFPTKAELKNEKGSLEYIAIGENEKIHLGYKCGIRDEWQILPSLWIPDAFFIRRNNLFPKFIINQASAYSTDTMHRVRMKKDVDIKLLASSYYNSLSFAFAEIKGRSHGGGVLELMPNEVEEILIPYQDSDQNLAKEIDEMFRKNMAIEEILNYTNRIILKENYGFSDYEIKLANNIWNKLRNRRLNRKNTKELPLTELKGSLKDVAVAKNLLKKPKHIVKNSVAVMVAI